MEARPYLEVSYGYLGVSGPEWWATYVRSAAGSLALSLSEGMYCRY